MVETPAPYRRIGFRVLIFRNELYGLLGGRLHRRHRNVLQACGHLETKARSKTSAYYLEAEARSETPAYLEAEACSETSASPEAPASPAAAACSGNT